MTLELTNLNLNCKDKHNVLAKLKDDNNNTIFLDTIKSYTVVDYETGYVILTYNKLKQINFNNVKIKEV